MAQLLKRTFKCFQRFLQIIVVLKCQKAKKLNFFYFTFQNSKRKKTSISICFIFVLNTKFFSFKFGFNNEIKQFKFEI